MGKRFVSFPLRRCFFKFFAPLISSAFCVLQWHRAAPGIYLCNLINWCFPMVTSVFFFCCLPFKAQANLSVQALEERLKKLEGKTETDSVELALQALHRTLDKSRFDPEDAVMDLESLVKVAKINNHAKAREYECVLDEVQKHSKSLNQKSLRDLLVALVGDPIKSKVLEKTHKLLKHTTPENRSTSFPSWRRYNNRFTYHQGGSRDNRGRGGFQASRSASPFANRRLRSSPCYFCGSTEHFIKDCAEFQDMKSARARNKSA